MQYLPDEILSQSRKEKMKYLDEELKKNICGEVGERIECPKCHYSSKKNKFSAILFENSIKCFSCGLWRKFK